MAKRFEPDKILTMFNRPISVALNHGTIETPHGDVIYDGPKVTMQDIAFQFDVSDSTARRAAYSLRKRGLVDVTTVSDPDIGHDRLWVTPTTGA